MTESESHLQHLLLIVDAAQRAGHPEDKIVEIVEGAFEADAELDAAA